MHEPARSFDEFFHENYDAVRRSLAIAYRDPLLAEELAQDAFTRAFANWRRISQMDRPAGWVYIVALRAGRRRRANASAPAEFVTGDHADDVARDIVLRDAIAALPERQRLALVLRFHVDRSLADVATAMDCAIGTVKATLHAALASLGVEMREEEFDVSR